MQKKFIYAALASAMLLCSACGAQNDVQNNETITDESTADTSENNTSGNAPATDNTEQSLSVSVEFQTEKNDAAEEGTIIYTSVIVYPVVSIEGNESAAEKINADIQTRIDAFQADTSTMDMAREIYQSEPGDSEYPFMAYSSDLDFTVTRADSNVISFTATYYAFSGGAHGNYTTVGINYSPQTGELIDFSELSENADAFHTNTFAFIEELAASESYQEKLFPSTSAEELESTLYADEKWYFSTSGLTFISDPYLLGPYAAGMITFTIPYADLKEMGLKEEYQYTGNLAVKLEDGDSYTMDINGDGTEDTIQISTTYEEKADGSADFIPHLVINDVDISQGYNEELSGILAPWPAITLYDMNPEDDFVEIAVSVTQINETTGETETITTYFFRCEKDASVTYIGMTRGAATDPFMDTSDLTQ